MWQIIFAVILFSLSSTLGAEDREFESDIVAGKRYSFNSETLGENHKYRVLLPTNYESNRSRKYPVIYVLDGFDRHSLTVHQLASNYWLWANRMPAAIVVGLPSNNRRRDYTAVNSLKGLNGDERANFSETGGAEHYRDFLKSEFIPHIGKHYRTNGDNIVVGHSLAGHFVVWDLLSENRVFDGHIAIDPSFWFGDDFLYQKLSGLSEKHLDFTGRFYVSTALRGRHPNDTNLSERVRRKAKRSQDFIDILKQKKSEKLLVRLDIFEREDHVSVLTGSMSDGLAHVFYGYLPLQDKVASQSADLVGIHSAIVEKPRLLSDHYMGFSEKIGKNYPPEERLIAAAGVRALSENRFESALKLIELGIAYYPEHSLMWYGLAEYNEKIGKLENAIKAYQKVLELEPDDEYALNQINTLLEKVD